MEMQRTHREDLRSVADRTSIAEIMSTKVVCVTADLSLEELTHLFVEHGISGAPVVDDRGKTIGVVSKTDVVRECYEHADDGAQEVMPLRIYSEQGSMYELGEGFHSVPVSGASVRDIMTPVAYTLGASTSISQAAALMAFEGIHRVPIVAEPDGEIVGVLSALDVLRWLGEHDGYLRRRPSRDGIALG